MFHFLRIKKIVKKAKAYVEMNYAPHQTASLIAAFFGNEKRDRKARRRRSYKNSYGAFYNYGYSGEPRFSLSPRKAPTEQEEGKSKETVEEKASKERDLYDAEKVKAVIRDCQTEEDVAESLSALEKNVDQTFVDKMIFYVEKKGVKDSDVYKAALIDKRLYSKMISNREYKPAKDTAIAILLALELSLEDAADMLSRAGYTLSHSDKRDVIIEFLFRERIYDLVDANIILQKMKQKIIGREKGRF